jgi:hypothetical protein
MFHQKDGCQRHEPRTFGVTHHADAQRSAKAQKLRTEKHEENAPAKIEDIFNSEY